MTHKPQFPPRPLSENYGHPWSPDDDAQLRRLSEWMTRKEMANALGRTPLGVQGRCKALGIRLIRDDLGMKRFYAPSHVEGRAQAEENDTRFVRALALAIYRGDHLPGASARA